MQCMIHDLCSMLCIYLSIKNLRHRPVERNVHHLHQVADQQQRTCHKDVGTTPAKIVTPTTATTTTVAITSKSLAIDPPNLRDGIAESFARNHRLRLFLIATNSSATVEGAI